MLNILPDRITGRFDRHAAFYARIGAQLCFLYHIGIPLREILIHRGNRFYKLLVFCHFHFLHHSL